MAPRACIFIYPAVMIVWRMILIPYLYMTLWNTRFGSLIAEYAVTGLCFAGLTAEIFTVFYVHGVIRTGIFPLLAVDGALLLMLLVLGLWELNRQLED